MIDRSTVEKIAALARLRLDAEEADRMTEQLGRVLDYIDQLSRLDTQGVEPLAHPLDLVNAFDGDDPAPSLPREDILANAPSHDGECFRVPPVL